VRSFFALMERNGHPLVLSVDLAARVEADELAALRASGVLRPSSPRGTPKLEAREEISAADFVRLLRDLWGIDPGGLTTPGSVFEETATLGWCGRGAERREVILVAKQRGVSSVLARARRILVLVLTDRWVTAAERAKHGPDALVAVEALDVALVARGGRVVRDGVPADRATDAGAAEEAKPSSRSAGPGSTRTRGRRARVQVVPGAKRFNAVTVWRLDDRTVRVGVGGRFYKRTHADLGMAHEQSREPLRHWELLLAFLEGRGYLETSRFGGVAATKKLVSRLRAALRAAFELRDDPFHRYERKSGWRTRFVAHPGPPVEE
jgi:hypothetical protein